MDRNEKAKQEFKDKQEEKKNYIFQYNNDIETYNKNKPLIEKLKRDFDLIKRMAQIKKKGMKVLDPKFEFETFKEWEELGKEQIDIDIETREYELNINLDKIKEQQERINNRINEIFTKLVEIGVDVQLWEKVKE